MRETVNVVPALVISMVAVLLVGGLIAVVWRLRPSRRASALAASAEPTLDRYEWMDRAGGFADDIDVLLATAPGLPVGAVTDAALRHQVAQIEAGLRSLAGRDAGTLGPIAARAAIALRSWATAFEAASMIRRSDALATPQQLQTSDTLVTNRAEELRLAVEGLRRPPII